MKNNDIKYLHAAARTRSLENRMISQQDLMKVVDAEDAQGAFRILSGWEMFKGFEMKEYEVALEKSLKETYELVENITDKSEITYIFRYQTDGHNLKVYVKSQAAKGDFEKIYKTTGTFSVDKMKEEMASGRFEQVPEKLGQAAIEASDRLAKTKDSQIVDILIDKAVLSLMSEKAGQIGNSLISEYVKAKIDLINIETAVRLIRMKKDAYQVKKVFALGGSIDPDDIHDGYSEGYEGIGKLLEKAGQNRRLGKSVPALKKNEALTVMEQEIDGCFKDLFDKARTVPFGLEPIMTFLYLKEREIKAVRMVLVSKIFGISGEKTAERIRYIYAD